MHRNVNTIIDQEICTGCGLCVKVCPSDTISMVGGKAAVTGTESLNCGHCQEVCPVDAIRVTTLEQLEFVNFAADNSWLKPGTSDTAQLVRLMGSRRSCRNFKDKPVERSLLEDLVKIGTTAPSGSNWQEWTFTILPERKDVEAFGDQVMGFYKKLNKMANNAPLRNLLKLIGQPALSTYYEAYAEKTAEAIAGWTSREHDSLFHGAPAAIAVGASANSACPAEDALLATQNILLGAHSLGLGTCLIGFAVEAMKRDKKIINSLGAANGENCYAVIAIGWPDEQYQQVAYREPITPRYPK